MNKSNTNLVQTLQKAWEDGAFTKYLKALEDLFLGSVQLDDNTIREIVVVPFVTSVKATGQQDWWHKIYLCAVASKASEVIGKRHRNLAGELKGKADKAREEILAECESDDERNVIQDLVFSLEHVKSDFSFDTFDRFLGDLKREEGNAGAVARSGPVAFRGFLKDLRDESNRVFSYQLQRLTAEGARNLQYRLDSFIALTNGPRRRLEETIQRLDQQRILDELDIDEFDKVSGFDKGVKAVKSLRDLLRGDLFKKPLTPDQDNNARNKKPHTPDQDNNARIKRLNEKVISAVNALDRQIGKSLPDYSSKKLEYAFGLEGFVTSMDNWLMEQTGESDCDVLDKALSMVAAWKDCHLAGKPMLTEQAYDRLADAATVAYEIKLLDRARGLLKDADRWQAEHLADWEAVKRGCNCIVSSRDERAWAIWHLVVEVLGMVHSEPEKYQEILGVLRADQYKWRLGKHTTTDLVSALASEEQNRHARTLVGIVNILRKSKEQPEATVSDELQALRNWGESVFTGLLESYAGDIQELYFWQKLANVTSPTDVFEISKEIGQLIDAELSDLQQALERALASIRPGAQLSEKPDLYFSEFSLLMSTFKSRSLVASGFYRTALEDFIERLCAGEEEKWERWAREGKPRSILESYSQLKTTVPWIKYDVDSEQIDSNYNQLWTDASVRNFIEEKHPLKAVTLAVSREDYGPGNDVRQMLPNAVSEVAARNLSISQLNRLLEWDFGWDDRSLRAIADGCFRLGDGELLSKLSEIRSDLPKGYDQLTDWHEWRMKQDRLLLEALAASTDISSELKKDVVRLLSDNRMPRETICLVWDLFADRLSPETGQPTAVEASLRARKTALDAVSERLGNLPRVFGFDAIPHKYTESDVEELVRSVKRVRENCRSTLEKWREGTDPVIGELRDRICKLDSDIKYLEPQWARMIDMLSNGDPNLWSQVSENVKQYLLGTGAGSVLVGKTNEMLQSVLYRVKRPSEHIADLRTWRDGDSDTGIPQERLRELVTDFEKEPDLLKGHSKADGDLEAFIAGLNATADCLKRWNEQDRWFDKNRTNLRDYASHGTGRPSGTADFIKWYDEMKKANSDGHPGVLRAWFRQWESNSGKDFDKIMAELYDKESRVES